MPQNSPQNLPQNLPQALQHKGIYYGYVVLFVGTIGIIASVPGQTMGISVFTEHLVQAFGIDRLTLSLLYLFGTLASSFLLPYAGRLLDRLGARFLAVLACTGLSGFLLLLAQGPALAQGFSSFSGLSTTLTSAVMIFVCFFGIRHFGQGQLTIASRTMMGKWFVRKRGLVLGISGIFVAFGFGITPYFLNALITTFTWSTSLILLATGLIVVAAIAFIFFKEAPEDYGLRVDGGFHSESSENQDKELPAEISFTAQEAKKTFTFWVFNLGVSVQALVITGITFNIADIGLEQGIESAKAFEIFIYVSILAVITQLISGYLSDKISLRFILAGMQASLAAALIGLQFFNTTLGFAIVALGLGISSGAFSLLTAAAWPKLFGRAHLGSINGLVSAWMVGASALGPYMLSQGKALTSNYSLILGFFVALPLILFIAAFFAKTPQAQKQEQKEPHDQAIYRPDGAQ